MINLTKREITILAGLYLSKFDNEGLKLLGFDSFTEAFNVIGLALGIKPASVKNYRDEFDPLFPNERQGWHKREMRQNCKDIYSVFGELSLDRFSVVIKDIIYKNHEMDILMEEIAKAEGDKESSFAKRLITGQAAEQYFIENYLNEPIFKDFTLINTTQHGCGFDFKLINDNPLFLGVEVKGLNENSGNIVLTNKEYSVSRFLKDRYFVYVVKNFKENPYHQIYQNPIQTLNFQRVITQVEQIQWNVSV